MFYAIVMSGPMAEHNNGRLNTIGLGLGRPYRPYSTGYPRRRKITTFSHMIWNFMELCGTLRLGEKFRNFMELYNGSDGMEQLWGTLNLIHIDDTEPPRCGYNNMIVGLKPTEERKTQETAICILYFLCIQCLCARV